MNLIIDIGNTAAKLVLFEQGEPIHEERTSNTTLEALPRVMERFTPGRAAMSSVIDLTDEARAALDALPIPLLTLDATTPLPVRLRYRTPCTLGADRLAAVVGAMTLRPGCELLVIDAGTCITYERVSASGIYLGGNISPGLEMRFKALRDHTARLPLVCPEGETPNIGYDTDTAIRAGVRRGFQFEIEGNINAYLEECPTLSVFLTGGNSFNFGTPEKSCIFADKYLVPRGLNRILEYNEQHHS